MLRYYYLYICFLITTCLSCERPTFSANHDTKLKCDVKMRIDSGWVCGRVREAEQGVKYASFRDIPYAQQPLQELRFKELQPLDPWPNVQLATEEGPICPQYDEIYGRLVRPVGMSESCIHANVHVPLDAFDYYSKDICQKTGLPILVFIHGGGFQIGSGGSDFHGPEYLVSKGVILITFNYRVILMSGVGNAGFYTTSPAYAQTVATAFLKNVGINSTDAKEIHKQLVHMPLEKIMQANRITQFTTGLVSFVPVVEAEHAGVTRILDDYPDKLVKRGRGKDLPMIVGNTNIECEAFRRRIGYLDLVGIIENNHVAVLPLNITYSVSESTALNLAEVLMDRYYKGGVTVDKIIKSCSDQYFSYPAFKLAEWRAAQGAAPLYKYLITFDSDFNVVKFGFMLKYEGGSAHLEDQTFVLRVNSFLDQDEKSFPPRTRDDLMKHWMTTFVVNFMRCCHPLCDNQSEWPATDEKRLNYQLLTEPVYIYNNINMTTEQRDMFDFHDNLFKMAGQTVATAVS